MLALPARGANKKLWFDRGSFGVYLLVSERGMKREIDLVIFDLDGTLADTGQDLANAVNYVRSSLHLEPLDGRLVYDNVGRGVEHLLRSSLPQTYDGRFQEVMELFLQRYEKHLLDTTVLYPNVREILDYFQQKKRAVVSNKLHYLTVSVLRGLGIEICFDAILGGDSVPQKKPDPQPLNQVLSAFGVSPKKALMVGDGGTDIEAGKRAGVLTCGVTYGLGKGEEIIAARPDILIDHLRQLTDYFY
ncbi:HAD family hydrolase [bacterium]|nr:MAG: HAD family hydrolase [bacterium]